MLIELVDVCKHFGHLHALKHVNLDVPAGQKLVIIGPSGSGKSTLIRCVNMLEKPSSGRSSSTGSSSLRLAHRSPR
jgi:aspartate/glutamate/glutamine transport system ATP-binding protein